MPTMACVSMREGFSAVYISKRAAVAAIRGHARRPSTPNPPSSERASWRNSFTTAMIRGPLFAEPRGRGWYIADAEMREVSCVAGR